MLKNYLCTRCPKGKEKVKEGQERKGERDLRRKDEKREYGEDKHSVCMYVCFSVAQSRLTLYDPMDCSPPGSSVHGILLQDYWSG